MACYLLSGSSVGAILGVAAGGIMVWLGGPRGRAGRRNPIVLNDPPPDYHQPRSRIPLKDRQREVRDDWVLMRVANVILVLAAAAFIVIIMVYIVTHM
jgi:hypothetical protein